MSSISPNIFGKIIELFICYVCTLSGEMIQLIKSYAMFGGRVVDIIELFTFLCPDIPQRQSKDPTQSLTLPYIVHKSFCLHR